MAKQSGLATMTSTAVEAAPVEEEAEGPGGGVVLSTSVEPNTARMRLPYLGIAQAMSDSVKKRQAEQGDLILRNYPPAKELLLVPISSGNYRKYQPDRTRAGRPQCQSNDGVVGHGDPGGLCAECPLSKWGPKNPQTGKSTPPPCKEGVMWCFYSIDHRDIVLFPFQGQSASIADDIRRRAMFSGPGTFAVRMTTQLVENNLGAWYAPKVEIVFDIPEEHRAMVARAVASMGGGAEPAQTAPPASGTVLEGEVVNGHGGGA